MIINEHFTKADVDIYKLQNIFQTFKPLLKHSNETQMSDPGPFSWSAQLSMKLQLLIKLIMLNKKDLLLNSCMYVKMPTIFGWHSYIY